MARHLPAAETRLGPLVVGYIESILTHADYTAGATSEALSLPALPAGSIPLRAKANPGAYFTGGGAGSAALDVGDAGDPDGLLDNLDVFTGGATIGTWAGTAGIEAEYHTKPAATVGADIAAFTAATVGADIGAFTDPPAAAEMALLRTFVNAVKADHAATLTDLATLRTFVNALKTDLAAIRGARGPIEESSYTAKATLTSDVNVADLTAGSVKIRQYYMRWDDE